MEPDVARAVHQRIDAVRSFDVSLGRRLVGTRTIQHGCAYRMAIDETAFRGTGDLGLFGAVLAEALSRTAAVNTFAELTVTGLKTGFQTTYAPRARS
jgi:type VI protein secretion system component VasA